MLAILAVLKTIIKPNDLMWRNVSFSIVFCNILFTFLLFNNTDFFFFLLGLTRLIPGKKIDLSDIWVVIDDNQNAIEFYSLEIWR
jgi:hypothetical protein